MELTALAFFLAHNPQAQHNLPDFATIDGHSVSHAEGKAALQSGHAVLVGGLLIGSFNANHSAKAAV
ncbi:hypothetical protein [Hymenobacter volaticus]|uniref:Uncharacterized protein n=1 Tax=Hymenobacter volaticus TaxID=2932254 RepID=A0ABY4GE64_9BACT|nr:hypothetical protein [Hymenobacter volaticus]UOQ68839.1 hypothetical protein MUN86_25570 [Hymenobacter volaticus]